MSEKFLQMADIVSAFVPVDMQTGANDGDWISMANFSRVLCVLFKGAGTAGDDPIFKLQQATDNAGAGAKDLNFAVIYEKVGAQASTLDFTRVTQTAAASYTNTASAEVEAIIAVEIQADELDVDGGFDHIQLSVANVGGNAQLGCAFYIMDGAAYPQQIAAQVQ